jgi:hypothetical protein
MDDNCLMDDRIPVTAKTMKRLEENKENKENNRFQANGEDYRKITMITGKKLYS